MLDRFPPEVVSLISSFCAQADVVSLAIASPTNSDHILRDIYRVIVVDTVPRKFYGSRLRTTALTTDSDSQITNASSVTTLGGIKQLLRTLKSSPKYAKMVRSLSFRGNISLSGNILLPQVYEVLQNLTEIKEFEWTASPELPPKAIAKIGNNEILSIKVDLAITGETLPSVQFNNLRTLGVRPFLNLETLQWLRQIVGSSQLENVEISRYLDLKPKNFSFSGTSFVNHRSEEVSIVSTFFCGAQWNIRKLSLIQTDTRSTDIELFRTDLSNLKELRLVGTGNERENDHHLLKHIIDQKPQLNEVELNWRASCHLHFRFFEECCQGVNKLKLTVREAVPQLLTHIVKCCADVSHLEIDILCPFTLGDLDPLLKLKSVKFLKLPFRPTVNSWETAVLIKSLEVLKLVNSDNGAQPTTLGLLTNNFDDYLHSPFKCANIAAFARTNPNLEVLIVDDQVMNLRRHPKYE